MFHQREGAFSHRHYYYYYYYLQEDLLAGSMETHMYCITVAYIADS